MKRRQFMQAGMGVAGAFALGRSFWQRAYAAPAQLGDSPYGELQGPDENGLFLPPGFTSRKIAESYSPVALAAGGASSYLWHRAPDGGGVVPQEDGGWIYVSNSEVPIVADECSDDPTGRLCQDQGGAGAIRFDKDGNVIDAYVVLEGTNNNCAGGVTPWGTWLSCEENFGGFVYECDPTGLNQPIRLVAMGEFNHEAAAVDPIGKAIYMTEDAGDGAFYRFIPAVWPDDGRPDLTVGELQVAVVGDDPPVRVQFQDEIMSFLAENPLVEPDEIPFNDITGGGVEETSPGQVTWQTVPNPSGGANQTRYQVPTAAIFDGGEGCWYDDGMVFFTCKGTDRVWGYDTIAESVDIIYDASELGEDAPLTGVDNLVVHAQSHDLFVAEDGGNMEIVLITDEDRTVAPFMRYPIPHSEICGPAFDQSGTRLYFASQAKRHRLDDNGNEVRGEIIEISGPFRKTGAESETPNQPAGAAHRSGHGCSSPDASPNSSVVAKNLGYSKPEAGAIDPMLPMLAAGSAIGLMMRARKGEEADPGEDVDGSS